MSIEQRMTQKTRKNRWVRRNFKRQALVKKYQEQRQELKKKLVAASGDFQKQWEILALIEKLPKDSSSVRVRNRCPVNGRPRGTNRKVGVCRALFRSWIMEGYLPGFVMSSW